MNWNTYLKFIRHLKRQLRRTKKNASTLDLAIWSSSNKFKQNSMFTSFGTRTNFHPFIREATTDINKKRLKKDTSFYLYVLVFVFYEMEAFVIPVFHELLLESKKSRNARTIGSCTVSYRYVDNFGLNFAVFKTKYFKK